MIEEQVKEAVLPVVEEMGLNLYKVAYEKENGKNYLRIFLEKENYSLDLDTCVAASEKISKILDKLDPIDEEYFLEVSSCGERELNGYDEYLRALDKYIVVEVKERVLDYDELVGDLVGVNKEEIQLRLNLKGRIKTVSIPFSIIEKAHLSFKV